MLSKYYQNFKEKLRTEALERYQNLSEEENKKRRKNYRNDIKVLLKNKKKKGVSVIRIANRSYLSIEEIIISHIKNKYSVA